MILGEITFVIIIAIQSSMSILYATLGEIYTERSGVLNLGIEGIMLMGALVGFATTFYTQNLLLGVLAAMIVGGLMASVHAFLTVTLQVNQVVSGITIFTLGIGLTDYFGQSLIGEVAPKFSVVGIPLLQDIPVIGQILFQQNALVYAAYILVPLMTIFLFNTKYGLNIRSVGEKPSTADTLGVNVFRIRYLCTIFGGMLAGLGGSYLSLSYIPGWRERMTGGQGWIAIALTIFSMRNPVFGSLGAVFFGLINAFRVYSQASQIAVPTFILKMLPYLCTIFVLVVVSKKDVFKNLGVPSALGKPYSREDN